MSFSIIDPRSSGGLPAPGICKSCGSATKESYLDTGTSEEFYGSILYCNECIGYMASLFGFITPENAEQLRTKVEEMYLTSVNLAEKNKALKGAVDGLVRSGFDGSAFDFIELDLVELASYCIPNPQRREEPVDDGENEVSESGSLEGSDGVSESEPKSFSLFE